MGSKGQVNIGLAGLGNVGAGVFQNLRKNAGLLRQRCGRELKITRIAVRDPARKRKPEVPAGLLTDRWQDLVDDESIGIIVELIGGTDNAFHLVESALRRGKIVVTGNKALLAERGREIFRLARKMDVPVYFEAAVAGGIPIIKAVQESLVGNRIESIYGIINGTCNYILTRMRNAGLRYPEALKEAQALGYAEADPTLDVNGWDAGHKVVLLGCLVSGEWVDAGDVSVEGVESVHATDIRFAEKLGYTLKLIAVVKRDENDGDDGSLEVRVQPSLIRNDHLLAAVNGVFNAVMVRGDVVGETLFYGSGAGQDPTSSAVISDIVDAARALRGTRPSDLISPDKRARVKPIDETLSHYYLRLTVENKPGVLAQVAAILGHHNAGITTVLQPETEGEIAELVLVVEDANYGEIKRALQDIRSLPCNQAEPTLLRMETL